MRKRELLSLEFGMEDDSWGNQGRLRGRGGVLAQAAVTEYPRLAAYTTDVYVSQFWEMEVQGRGPAWWGASGRPRRLTGGLT